MQTCALSNMTRIEMDVSQGVILCSKILVMPSNVSVGGLPPDIAQMVRAADCRCYH